MPSPWIAALLGGLGGGFMGKAQQDEVNRRKLLEDAAAQRDIAENARRGRQEGFTNTLATLEAQDKYGLVPSGEANAQRDLAKRTSQVDAPPSADNPGAGMFRLIEAARASQLGKAPSVTLPGSDGAPQSFVADPTRTRFAREESQKARDRLDAQQAAADSRREIAKMQADAREAATAAGKAKRTPHSFTVRGKPMFGFADELGNLYDAKGQPIQGDVTPFTPPAQSTISIVPGAAGEPAKSVVTHGPGLGTVKDLPGVVKTASGESAVGQASKARLASGVSQMDNAHAAMRAYETKLRAGTADINGLEQFMGAVGATFSHEGLVSKGAQSLALAALNRTNPELARYIRRGLEFAQGESMITNRPSDFRVRLSDFLSTASSGASPEMIDDIQNTREATVAPLRQFGPAKPPASAPGGRLSGAGPGVQGPQGGGAPKLPTEEQQLWDAAVAKHGRAKVLAEYGPRPE